MAKSKPVAEESTKTSYMLKKTAAWKLKYISTIDSRPQSDILEEIINQYAEKWEKKNGTIPEMKS